MVWDGALSKVFLMVLKFSAIQRIMVSLLSRAGQFDLQPEVISSRKKQINTAHRTQLQSVIYKLDSSRNKWPSESVFRHRGSLDLCPDGKTTQTHTARDGGLGSAKTDQAAFRDFREVTKVVWGFFTIPCRPQKQKVRQRRTRIKHCHKSGFDIKTAVFVLLHQQSDGPSGQERRLRDVVLKSMCISFILTFYVAKMKCFRSTPAQKIIITESSANLVMWRLSGWLWRFLVCRTNKRGEKTQPWGGGSVGENKTAFALSRCALAVTKFQKSVSKSGQRQWYECSSTCLLKYEAGCSWKQSRSQKKVFSSSRCLKKRV